VPTTTAVACTLVLAAVSVEVPPMSEAVFSVEAEAKLPIEAALENTCRSPMVARTLMRAPTTTFTCRVMKPTGRSLKLATSATVGVSIDSIVQMTWRIAVGRPSNTNAQVLVYWAANDVSFLTDPESPLRRKLTSTCVSRNIWRLAVINV
jgi:hypothetical protein